MASGRRGRPPHPDILTPAEWRVLEHLREGKTNAEIAVRLGITPDGVKFHVSNMLAKLNLPDRAALAAWEGDAATSAPHRAVYGVWHAPIALKLTVTALAALLIGGAALTAFAVTSGSSADDSLPDVHASPKVTSFELAQTAYMNSAIPIPPGAPAGVPSHFGPQTTSSTVYYSKGTYREERTDTDGKLQVNLHDASASTLWVSLPSTGPAGGTTVRWPSPVPDAFATAQAGYPIGATSLQELVAKIAPGAPAKLDGEDTVARRPVYRIAIGPPACKSGEPDLDGPRMLWIDKETLFILKQEQYSAAGGAITNSSEVTRISYNEPLAADLFQPPPAVHIIDATGSTGSTNIITLKRIDGDSSCPSTPGAWSLTTGAVIASGTVQVITNATGVSEAAVQTIPPGGQR